MSSQGSQGARNMPVFCHPSVLYFFAADASDRRKSLTIYNPYEFPVRYKMLSNAREKYTVMDPEGAILPKNRVDVVIRLIAPEVERCLDKFRLQLYSFDRSELLGSSDVPTIISAQLPPSCDPHRAFSQSLAAPGSSEREDPQPLPPPLPGRAAQRSVMSLAVQCCVAVAAVIVLLLPYSGDPEYRHIAWYLRTSVTQRCVASFVLGLLVYSFFI